MFLGFLCVPARVYNVINGYDERDQKSSLLGWSVSIL